MRYTEHDDMANVEATRAFLAFGPTYPDAIPRTADRYAGYERSASEDKARPEGRPSAEQLRRLRPDRLVLAGGSLAAAAAVAIAFATAGGSATTAPPRTAATHAAQPACISPAAGR